MFDKLFDLPAHPLLVHAPVVLLPIAAILMVMFAVKPAWRLAAGWWPLCLVGVTVVLLLGAKESGEALIEAYDRVNGEGAVHQAARKPRRDDIRDDVGLVLPTCGSYGDGTSGRSAHWSFSVRCH